MTAEKSRREQDIEITPAQKNPPSVSVPCLHMLHSSPCGGAMTMQQACDRYGRWNSETNEGRDALIGRNKPGVI